MKGEETTLTPTFEKLLIKPNTAYFVIDAPPFWIEEMQKNDLRTASTDAAVVHWFVRSKAEFEQGIPQALAALVPSGRLWISYHKETKTLTFDIHRDSLAQLARGVGLRPFRQVAINEDWSALGFVRAA